MAMITLSAIIQGVPRILELPLDGENPLPGPDAQQGASPSLGRLWAEAGTAPASCRSPPKRGRAPRGSAALTTWTAPVASLCTAGIKAHMMIPPARKQVARGPVAGGWIEAEVFLEEGLPSPQVRGLQENLRNASQVVHCQGGGLG
jgi:hypothetical protein